MNKFAGLVRWYSQHSLPSSIPDRLFLSARCQLSAWGVQQSLLHQARYPAATRQPAALTLLVSWAELCGKAKPQIPNTLGAKPLILDIPTSLEQFSLAASSDMWSHLCCIKTSPYACMPKHIFLQRWWKRSLQGCWKCEWNDDFPCVLTLDL